MSLIFSMLPINGLLLVEPRVFEDERGFFMEIFKASEFRSQGIDLDFVQDNHSLSKRGVLRGLHFQRPPHTQAKLVRVIAGAVWDVAVDLRPGSPSYGRWYGLELSAQNRLMLFIPEGFAHGFITLVDGTELVYKCSTEYRKESDGGVRWDDPDIGIDWPWPLRDVLVSEKDAALPLLRDLK
jgi:dTDP-4-dehydrorhamnose 3,5-epimerase